MLTAVVPDWFRLAGKKPVSENKISRDLGKLQIRIAGFVSGRNFRICVGDDRRYSIFF
jgi:hypothetical protein